MAANHQHHLQIDCLVSTMQLPTPTHV